MFNRFGYIGDRGGSCRKNRNFSVFWVVVRNIM